MNEKCIYLYSDILGYKDLINTKSVDELKNMTESIIDEIELLVNSESKKEKSNLSKFSLVKNPLKSGQIKLYFAFDTIVLYWEKFDSDFSWPEYDSFLNLVSIVYLILFTKYKILIRGVISESTNYYISDRVFIIKEIEKSYLIEKNQNWGNICISLPGVFDITAMGLPMDDPYKKIEAKEIPFKEDIQQVSSKNKNKWKYEDLFVPRFIDQTNQYIHVLNQINATSVEFLNQRNINIKNAINEMIDISKNVKDKSAVIKISNTIDYLNDRIKEYEWFTMSSPFIDDSIKDRYEKIDTPYKKT